MLRFDDRSGSPIKRAVIGTPQCYDHWANKIQKEKEALQKSKSKKKRSPTKRLISKANTIQRDTSSSSLYSFASRKSSDYKLNNKLAKPPLESFKVEKIEQANKDLPYIKQRVGPLATARQTTRRLIRANKTMQRNMNRWQSTIRSI